jgi:hypothetical protein
MPIANFTYVHSLMLQVFRQARASKKYGAESKKGAI